MKYTLAEVVQVIEQKLNYPGVVYEDLVPYLNQAISELNTMLHVSLDNVSHIVYNFRKDLLSQPNVILFNKPLEEMVSVEIETTAESIADLNQTQLGAWYTADIVYFYSEEDDMFGIIKSKVVEGTPVYSVNQYKELKGLYFNPETGSRDYAIAMKTGTQAYWYSSDLEDIGLLDFTVYLPSDWINLFIIPYVCAGFAAKDGGNAATFQDEFLQGYNQLRKAWHVPQRLYLNGVAGHPAYKELVEATLEQSEIDFNYVKVFPRAITEDMRYTEGTSPDYSEMSLTEDGLKW